MKKVEEEVDWETGSRISCESSAVETTCTEDFVSAEPVVVDNTNKCICGLPDDERFMIICDLCSIWYHGQCVGVDDIMAKDIVEYHCPRCEKAHGESLTTSKRKSGRPKQQVNYADLHNGVSRRLGKIEQLLESRTFIESPFVAMKGKDFNVEFIAYSGFDEPIMFPTTQGLDLKMPKSSITVMEIAELVGDIPVEVMDVQTQESLPDWTVLKWAHYFNDKQARKRLLNVISFEISGTSLAEMITRPKVVRDLDWIDKYWPKDGPPEKGFPKVQLYCLMSPSGAWTDFHIDFGGSSVFYHLLSGHKVFYMIPPTEQNLKAYQKWCQSPQQIQHFFADVVKLCYKVELEAGNTMLIPSGWIHAVYTVKDSIAIGGNFLHDFAIHSQLNCYMIEQNCLTPPTYRYPFFEKLCWYAAMGLSKENFADLPKRTLDGMQDLSDFLFLRTAKLTPKPFSKTPKDVNNKPFPLLSTNATTEEKKIIRANIPSSLNEKNKYSTFLIELAHKLASFKIGANYKVVNIKPVAKKKKASNEESKPRKKHKTDHKPHPVQQMPLTELFPFGINSLIPPYVPPPSVATTQPPEKQVITSPAPSCITSPLLNSIKSSTVPIPQSPKSQFVFHQPAFSVDPRLMHFSKSSSNQPQQPQPHQLAANDELNQHLH